MRLDPTGDQSGLADIVHLSDVVGLQIPEKAILELLRHIPLTAYSKCGRITAWHGTYNTMRPLSPSWRRLSGKQDHLSSGRRLPLWRSCCSNLVGSSGVRIATR
jgi:hypothetical protein